MEIAAERLPLFRDDRLLQPIYAHQRFLLHEGGVPKLKVHVPTAGGKTLGAMLFALRDTFERPDCLVRAILTYPTNLLSRDQFERSVVRALIEWIGAEHIAMGAINPIERRFVRDAGRFEEVVRRGVPTYVFKLPGRLGGRDLYVTVITGEGLQHLLSQENMIEVGRRKGTYLLAVLDVLNQRDHIILCSPDLLGYVAQRCYSVTGSFYNSRWRDELELKLAEHDVVIDEYHFYDPYTYVNLSCALERLAAARWLCLSATGTSGYFPEVEVLGASSRCLPGTGIGERIASYPIELTLHRDDLRIIDASPRDSVIYFFHSVIAAHETAEALRSDGVRLTEWTGIQKAYCDEARLVVATAAAEVGLDLPFREVHTEFWGNSWEVPSIIQRIGRVGRSDRVGRSLAHIWITGREPDLLFSMLDGRSTLTKAAFSELLLTTFGEPSIRLEDYVSYYLWDKERTRALRRFWQVPAEVERLRFHFRPPNSQAVFDWHGVRFAYDWIPIANRYRLEPIADVTDLPFWHEMGYAEWRVVEKRKKPEYHQRYDGRKDQLHRRLFW